MLGLAEQAKKEPDSFRWAGLRSGQLGRRFGRGTCLHDETAQDLRRDAPLLTAVILSRIQLRRPSSPTTTALRIPNARGSGIGVSLLTYRDGTAMVHECAS